MKRKTPLSFNHQLTFGVARRKSRRRWLLYLVVLPLVAGGVAYRLAEEFRPAAPEIVTLPAAPQAPQVAAPSAPLPPPVEKVDIEYVVQPNDTLGQIFRRLGLDAGELPAILSAPTVRDRFKLLQPGDRLTFALRNGVLHGLDRRLSEMEILSIRRRDGGFAARIVGTPVETRTALVRGTVNHSLFFAGRAVGLSPEMVHQLANDIFAWDIDFALGVRPGDRFKIVYEQRYRDAEYLGDGRIVAAEFVNDGEVHRAVRYTSPDGKVDGYFTPAGRSVRRPFLRTPIDFTRVNPKVGLEGRRTILHTLKEHQGIDYPAPGGTVVKAAGAGRVRFAGVNDEYGNTVIIEHGDGVSTRYAHLSALARDLQAHQRVEQGEIIGYVGNTGAATAPHLHYEYRIDGTHTDPRAADLPAGAPIPDEYRADFRSKLADLLAGLEQPGDAVVAALRAD